MASAYGGCKQYALTKRGWGGGANVKDPILSTKGVGKKLPYL